MKNTEDIKERLRKILKEEIQRQINPKKISLNENKIDKYLQKIPSLKVAVEKVLTPNYKHFLSDANVISPKPFTVRFKTKNGYYFELFIKDKGYVCKVSGKKYDLNTEGEVEKASTGITDLLSLGKPEPAVQNNPNGDEFNGLNTPTGDNIGSQSPTSPDDDSTFVPIDGNNPNQNIQGNSNLPMGNNT